MQAIYFGQDWFMIDVKMKNLNYLSMHTREKPQLSFGKKLKRIS